MTESQDVLAEPDPVDDMVAALRSAMAALDLTLWSSSGAHVFNGETALNDLALSLLARQVLAPSSALVRTPETLDVAPNWLKTHAEGPGHHYSLDDCRVALAASPAPDPGAAALREALDDATVTLHHIADDAEFRIAAIYAVLGAVLGAALGAAPSAEPPETETTP